MSHSIDATDRDNLNEHGNFNYEDKEGSTANKFTKDDTSDYDKLNKSAGQQSGLNLDA